MPMLAVATDEDVVANGQFVFETFVVRKTYVASFIKVPARHLRMTSAHPYKPIWQPILISNLHCISRHLSKSRRCVQSTRHIMVSHKQHFSQFYQFQWFLWNTKNLIIFCSSRARCKTMNSPSDDEVSQLSFLVLTVTDSYWAVLPFVYLGHI